MVYLQKISSYQRDFLILTYLQPTISMYYFYVKSIHIIFIVTWFAGLFYIVRLFVYFAETANLKGEERKILQKQYRIMQGRLWYGITWPSAIITAITGTLLALEFDPIPLWLWAKLGFVAFLFAYHFTCQYIFNQHRKGIINFSSNQLRVWNEVSTVLLVAIVFLVVLKNLLSMVWGLLGLIVFSAVLMAAIMIYKKIRNG